MGSDKVPIIARIALVPGFQTGAPGVRSVRENPHLLKE